MGNGLNIVLMALVLLTITSVSAQILTPVKWDHTVSREQVRKGEEVELIFTATLDDNWFIYSSDNDLELGPVNSEFTFEAHPSYKLIGDIIPVDFKEKYDEVFEGKVRYKDKKAVFKQRVKILRDNPVILGEYYYQVCTTVDGKCILGDDEFEFNVKTK